MQGAIPKTQFSGLLKQLQKSAVREQLSSSSNGQRNAELVNAEDDLDWQDLQENYLYPGVKKTDARQAKLVDYLLVKVAIAPRKTKQKKFIGLIQAKYEKGFAVLLKKLQKPNVFIQNRKDECFVTFYGVVGQMTKLHLHKSLVNF